MSQVFIQNIIKQLFEIQDGGTWLDESFRGKIDGISTEAAFTKPLPKIHSVAELVWHVLIWRRESLRRMNGQKIDLMNDPDNWRGNSELLEIGWDQLKKDFYESNVALIKTLKALDDTDLKNQYLDTDKDIHYLIEGLVHHDLYHLGQIGITIKLLKVK